MKNIIHKTGILLIILSASVSACKKDFVETNTNPNTSEFALPQALLAPAIADVVAANMNRSQRITNELMQVTVNMGDTEGKFFRYEVRNSEADYLWNAWYRELTNFKDVYKGAEDNKSNAYMGISLICQVWIYSMITDTYGDAPYFNSNMGREGVYLPAFDRQSDIYPDLFTKLEQANQILKTAEVAKESAVASSDPIYGGNVSKWRKFGNSLYLRLLLRVSAKTEIDAPSKIKEIVDTKATDYPVISNNEESAVLKWTGVGAYVSPFATWRDGDWYGPKLASFFVDNLNEWSDPRIVKWATLYQGEYEGIQSGYAVGEAPVSKSTLPVPLKTDPLLGNILNYAEVQLILAEAAAKGWITSKPAKSYYETGVTNAITFWGHTLPDNYFGGEHVKWDDSYSLDQKMELIHQQKYYTLFFTDLQSWFEYRRTGHPVLPKGPGLSNNGVMPARLNYPVYVQSANSANYNAAVAIQGPDDINTLVWWQRP
ncbi:SusD/RagB family nutrient-binding outer membrane lipoprotein [Arcticibacter tournemirensis]